MKKQKNKNWFAFIFTFLMYLKNVDSSQVESVSLIEREQDMKREKYFKITKSEIYKNHNFQKFDIFMISAKPETADKNGFGDRRYWYHFPALALIWKAQICPHRYRRRPPSQNFAERCERYSVKFYLN